MNSTRRVFIKAASIGTASFALPSYLFGREHSRQDQSPNGILVLSDDHRFKALGCIGHLLLETPHMDRMVKEGVHLSNAFVTPISILD